jgi:hypothetical protein
MTKKPFSCAREAHRSQQAMKQRFRRDESVRPSAEESLNRRAAGTVLR